MERVQGIGGLFFRYETHLGVTRTPTTYEETPWFQEAGPTVWGPFSAPGKRGARCLEVRERRVGRIP